MWSGPFYHNAAANVRISVPSGSVSSFNVALLGIYPIREGKLRAKIGTKRLKSNLSRRSPHSSYFLVIACRLSDMAERKVVPRSEAASFSDLKTNCLQFRRFPTDKASFLLIRKIPSSNFQYTTQQHDEKFTMAIFQG
jgi:hypothetical protein